MPSAAAPRSESEFPELRVYNIPPGAGFADRLVQGLLHETEEQSGDDPLALARYRILLPTRRGCRVIRDMFLRHSNGKPLILPRLQTLGDIDEDELSLQLRDEEDIAAFLALRPAIPAMKRRLLLARLVQQRDKTLSYGQAIGLADSLARLLDQVETESLSLQDLPELVPESNLAMHWQLTIDFLDILSTHWPRILEEGGYMGPAARRDALLRLQARIWQHNPPPEKIIAAGSTGSLPATALLLKTIAGLPKGRVVLPGLDQEMEQGTWEAVDESHPQATLRNLLQHMGLERDRVQLWNAAAFNSEDRSKILRRRIVSQMMIPAAESHRWTGLDHRHLGLGQEDEIRNLQQKLWYVTCRTPEEEARVIGLALRQALEKPGRTAALVTPDRNLARRVAMACRRWGIEVDDSAGIPLGDTPVGTFLLLILQACSQNLTPTALLPLLQHELCGFEQNQTVREEIIRCLDRYALRGQRPAPGLEGLRSRIETVQQGRDGEKLRPRRGQLQALIEQIDKALSPLLQYKPQPGRHVIEILIAAAETLANAPGLSGTQRLWRGAAGETASQFLSDLLSHADELPAIALHELEEMMNRIMAGMPVRTPLGLHPRLLILGQLEARLAQADLMILGGLNEGTWPPDPGQDPWMSRPMRKRFGLPPPERGIALAAHDFVQGFCADRVIMTRASRVDGKPSLPSRWLQRLETVLQAAGFPSDILFPQEAQDLLALARLGDIETNVRPAVRPAPCPPEEHRLKKISVTQIETLMNNPYGIYAREILKLPVIDPVDKPVDAAVRGTFIHDVLHIFTERYKTYLPENALQILKDTGYAERREMDDDSSAWDYWWPRFEALAESFITHERQWRTVAQPYIMEIAASMDIQAGNGFVTLRGRADRIDRMYDGTYAVIDYKSAGEYKKNAMTNGILPQLPLEAMLLNHEGFEEIKNGQTGYIGYWKLTGGRKGLEVTALDSGDGLQDIIGQASEGLRNLLETYAHPQTPFICHPDPARTPRFDDYRHLSRLAEWAHDEESGEEAAA